MNHIIVTQGTASFDEFARINNHQDVELLFAKDRVLKISTKINELLGKLDESFLVITSSDVILPDGWLDGVPELLGKTNKKWTNCVALTAEGITAFQHGYASDYRVSHLVEAGYEAVSTIELPVTSSSSDFVLINLKELRAQFPNGFAGFENESFHLWFCFELSLVGLSVIASPSMATYIPNRRRGLKIKPRVEKNLIDFIGSNLNTKHYLTTSGNYRITLSPDTNLKRMPVSLRDFFLRGLENNRVAPSLTIVTRTQFTRPKELSRCLKSITSFASHFGGSSLRLVIVSDRPIPDDLQIPKDFTFIESRVEKDRDSRFILVGEAVSKVESDYYLFVDDDDWMFPNNAGALRQLLSICPSDSVIFSDSRHYHEQRLDPDNVFVGTSLKPGRFFPGDKYPGSISGVNNNPFCSVVFPKSTFRDLPESAYSGIQYAEDYFLVLRTLYQDALPVVLKGELVGISIRESGNTVTEFGHVKWLRAKANVAHQLANSGGLTSGKFLSSLMDERRGTQPLIIRAFRVFFDGRLFWFAIQSGVLGKIFSGEVSLRYVFSKVSSLIRRGW